MAVTAADQEAILRLVNFRTGSEIQDSIDPLRYSVPTGDCRRNGASPLATPAENTIAINRTLKANRGGVAYLDSADARGTYLIDSNLHVPNCTTFRYGPGVTLKLAPNRQFVSTGMIDVRGRHGVRIEAYGCLDGNAAENPGGRVFGIAVDGSTNVMIDGGGTGSVINCPAQDDTGINGGDGIYVGGNGTRVVTVRDILLANNVRQGLSVTDCIDFTAYNVRAINTSGNNPGAGIDIEADIAGRIRGVRLINCILENNFRGLQIADAIDVLVSGLIINGSRERDIFVVRSQPKIYATMADPAKVEGVTLL
jgi:hypothetical protein